MNPIIFIGLIAYIIYLIVRNRRVNYKESILRNWVKDLPHSEKIRISAISIRRRKINDSVYTTSSFNSFMKVLPEELKRVNGKSTKSWSYTLAITNTSGETLSQIAFYCSEYDNLGRVDSKRYLCYTIDDLRPSETKQINIKHNKGVLVLEEAELFSTKITSIETICVRKAFPSV